MKGIVKKYWKDSRHWGASLPGGLWVLPESSVGPDFGSWQELPPDYAGHEASGRITHWGAGTAFHIDLNTLRDINNESQAGTLQGSSNPEKRIYVSQNGSMASGSENPDFTRSTEVDTSTVFSSGGRASAFRGQSPSGPSRSTKATGISFYAPVTARMNSAERQRYEEAIARVRMPENTYHLNTGRDVGWAYHFTNDIGDYYSMFMCYHPANDTYLVYLLEPRLEGVVDSEGCHFNDDASLCLRRYDLGGPGMPTMEGAYARSVLWSLGCSCFLRGYSFQFNKDQAD